MNDSSKGYTAGASWGMDFEVPLQKKNQYRKVDRTYRMIVPV
jgi:hypothetical protein